MGVQLEGKYMGYGSRWVIAGFVLTAVLLMAGAAVASAATEGGIASARAPQTKDMVFWLHWDPTSPTVNGQATQLTFNTSQYWTKTNYTIDGDKNLQMDFYLVPTLASDLMVNGTVTVGFWGNYSGSNNNFGLKTIISERNSTGSENWSCTPYSHNYDPASSPQYYSFPLTNFQHVFAAGSTIHLNLNVTGGSGIYKAIYVDTVSNNSRIVLPCQNYLAVPSVNTFDYLGVPQGGFMMSSNNTTILMRSTVTDPFGGYDVLWSNLTLTGPTGSVILNNQTMKKISGTPVSFNNIYEASWNYSGSPPGRYNITVWAVDNNGYYYCFYFMNFDYGYYAVNNTAFFFIGTPMYVNVKALDSTGVPLPAAEVSATILNNVTDQNITDGSGIANMSMQPGQYRFKVRWRGVLVANEAANITGNVTAADPLLIYCWVYYPSFKAVDSRGIQLVDAAVYVHYPNGSATILPFRTNASGVFGLSQTPLGPYELSVVWGGLEVNRTIVLVDGNITYTIHCDVFYLSVWLTDPHGSPVSGAQIVVNDSTTGIVADSRLSDLNGSIEFRLPRHFYDLTVYWYEAVVNTTERLPLLGDLRLDMVCGIYYFNVRSVDNHELPVENAIGVVSISSNGKVMDSRLSDQSGEFEIRVPTGFYNVSVWWQDVLVFSGGDIPVTADFTYVARCSIYYVTFTAVDSLDSPVENAQLQVHATATGRLLDAGAADASGNLTSRLPGTVISIVASWQDVLVNETPVYDVQGDGNLVVRCTIYYLMITALDDHQAPIPEVQLRICMAGNGRLLDAQSTGPDGKALSRLPASILNITASWEDTIVNQTPDYNLTASDTVELHCAVYYLDVIGLDSRSIPLEDAFVRVSLVDRRAEDMVQADASGRVTVRVPVGSVNVTITWANVLVGVVSGHMTDASHLLTVSCSVYYLDVLVTDSRDAPVSNAQVSFIRTATGKQMDVRNTGQAGNCTFRLPSEMYNITVVWQEQLVSPETGYLMERDGSLTLKCMIYYLTVKPVDSKGLPVENATIVFKQELTGNVLDTRVTGDKGEVTARLPIGRHTLMISWKDVLVNITPSYDLSGDSTLSVPCQIFYLTVKPADASAVTLAEAEVTIRPTGSLDGSTTLTTDARGSGTFRLPAQSYDIKVTWKGVVVCNRNMYRLGGDASLSLDCRVYYLTVKVADRDGKGLEGVQLTVYTVRGGVVYDIAGSVATNGSSKGVFRLPVGEYKVVARLRTTYLLTPVDMTMGRIVDLQESSTVRVVFDQYPVPVYTTNGFFAAMSFIVMLVAAAAVIYHLHRRSRGGPGSRSGVVVAEEELWSEKKTQGPAPEARPPEIKLAEAKPPEAKPPETKPPEAKPVQAKPPEAKPPETMSSLKKAAEDVDRLLDEMDK